MDVIRTRLGWVVEWLLAAAVIAGALGLGEIIIREFRSVRALTPVLAGPAPSPVPLFGVPSRSVSVPLLPLPDGRELRLGDSVSVLASALAGISQVAPEAVARDGDRQRRTRFYTSAGRDFMVVLEAQPAGGELKIVGIFLR